MTTFVDGQIKTTHLCTQCAANKKSMPPGPALSDFISAFYASGEEDTVVCENCGLTLSDFRKTGRLGCAECYTAFEQAVTPILKGVHMNTEHAGKHPGERVNVSLGDEEEKQTPKSRKAALRRELKVAVSTENYEEAAKLRDKIALLDKEED